MDIAKVAQSHTGRGQNILQSRNKRATTTWLAAEKLRQILFESVIMTPKHEYSAYKMAYLKA